MYVVIILLLPCLSCEICTVFQEGVHAFKSCREGGHRGYTNNLVENTEIKCNSDALITLPPGVAILTFFTLDSFEVSTDLLRTSLAVRNLEALSEQQSEATVVVYFTSMQTASEVATTED